MKTIKLFFALYLIIAMFNFPHINALEENITNPEFGSIGVFISGDSPYIPVPEMIEKKDSFSWTKYIFGESIDFSYRSFLLISLFFLFIITFALLLSKVHLNKKLNFILSLIISLIITNLKISIFITSKILGFAESNISQTIIIVFILIIIFIELWLIFKRKKNLVELI